MGIDRRRFDVPLSHSQSDRVLLRLEHWLLSRGSSDTSRLRGYLYTKEWRKCENWRERLRLVKTAAKFPARAARDAWQAVREHGATLTSTEGVSTGSQFVQLWWIRMRYGVLPPTYYTFRLHRPGQLSRAAHFFQGLEDDDLYRLVNVRTAHDEAELLLDKARLEDWLTARGVPTVRTLLELSNGAVVRSALPDGRLPRCDLFSKPSDGLQGIGTQRWTYDDGRWIGADGPVDEAGVMAALAELSRTRPVLIQQRLRNHPELALLAPAALSTIRVLTLRGRDGVVRMVLAVCRIPTGDATTDHFCRGAVGAPVDLETGRLRPAVRLGDSVFLSACTHHPDTGVPLEGFTLPCWDEVKRVAFAAHATLDRIVCVGWDVAILPEGPVIIEGNDNPGHSSSQTPTGLGLGETPIAATLLAWLHESFDRHDPLASSAPITPARPAVPLQ